MTRRATKTRSRTARIVAKCLAAGLIVACGQAAVQPDENDPQNLTEGSLYSGKWTNWYRRDVGFVSDAIAKATRDTVQGQQLAKARGLLKLGKMRDLLSRDNLFDTNPGGVPVMIGGEGNIKCIEPVKTAVRTINGSCNDPDRPAMGAAKVRFGRNHAPEATFADGADMLLKPNPRDISRKLLTRELDASGTPKVQEVPFLNLLASSWIQFMVHDWLGHGGVKNTGDLFSLPLQADDPFRAAHMEVMVVPKTETFGGVFNGKTTYFNENTHWWDGSQLYGSDVATADSLRPRGADGVLAAEIQLDSGGHMPLGKDGIEVTGFNRNWWLGLSMLHHVFASEHNDIVKMLRKAHPAADVKTQLAIYTALPTEGAKYEQWLYDRARMINAAEMAKIHTVEWTPAILPNPTLNFAMKANWFGALTATNLDTLIHPNPGEGQADSAFDRFVKVAGLSDPGLNGIVGAPKPDLGPNNTLYSLTEEFTSVYRMHSLLPETLQLSGQAVAIADTRNEKAHTFTGKSSMADLLTSFGAMHPGQLTLHNFPRFLQNLDIPGFDKYDLGAVDILRDRERGVPRYNKFRAGIHLKALDSIDDITTDPVVRAQLKEVYGDDADAINRVDLLIGCLAEGGENRPESFGFGETTFQVFLIMASRRLFADRFYAQNFNAETYTKEGLERIDALTFKGLLLRNYPELEAQLSKVKNAFLPWDGSVGAAVPDAFPDLKR